MTLYSINDVLEQQEQDPEIREMFEAFAQEKSRWERDDDLPDSMTARMFIAAVDWARANPKRWEAFYLRYYMELNVPEIAAILNHSEQHIRRLLEPVHYSTMKKRIIDGNKYQS